MSLSVAIEDKKNFHNDDYQYYLELMSEFTHQSGTQVWAYCLMPNHVHLVMVPSCEDGLRASLVEAHRRFTRHINFGKGWRGHLWQERFHSFSMDEQYLLATVRYVELNPVKAKLCNRPQDWRWSSALAHIKGSDDILVSVKQMLERVDNWQAYLSHKEPESNDLVSKHTRTGRPSGSEGFVKALEAICGRSLAPKKPRRSRAPRAGKAW